MKIQVILPKKFNLMKNLVKNDVQFFGIIGIYIKKPEKNT